MAEQLAYQREFNEQKAKKKEAEAAAAAGGAGAGSFKELSKEELGKLSMPE